MTYVVDCHKRSDADDIGGKASSLMSLSSNKMHIPRWFAIRSKAFEASLSQSQKQQLTDLRQQPRLSDTDMEVLDTILNRIVVLPDVINEIESTIDRLWMRHTLLAVRSSAQDEDGSKQSFAGQLETFLYVKPEDLAAHIVAVWKSAFKRSVLTYRQLHGLAVLPEPPAVLVQVMVNSQVAGVAFSKNPCARNSETTIVEAVYGLGHGLVQGELDADRYLVDRKGTISIQEIAMKTAAYYLDPSGNGIAISPVPEELSDIACITEEQLAHIVALAKRAEIHFGCPQDIEWAIEDGCLYLLQSRAITATASSEKSNIQIWDNSNIAESYNGVTTPLTFSFARNAYEHVYRQFCLLMNVSKNKIDSAASVFPNMLGLIQGRVYYNLLNWYKLLSLLPGYSINQSFMEQMMGVKEKLGTTAPSQKPLGLIEQAKEVGSLIIALSGLAVRYVMLNRDIERFYKRIDDGLSLQDGISRPDVDRFLQTANIHQLIDHFQDLENKLLRHWQAPIVNDFFTMIFCGLVRKTIEAWCPKLDASVANQLLVVQGNIVSAEPAIRIKNLADLSKNNSELTHALVNGDIDSIKALSGKYPEFDNAYNNYLAKFGDRCMEELKLETTVLTEDPISLCRAIGHMAQRLVNNKASTSGRSVNRMRLQAEKSVYESLEGNVFKKAIFEWLLSNARACLRNRENMRFSRTQVFGRVRRVFVEVGNRLEAAGLLHQARDIFYLEVQEVCAITCGTSTCSNLKQLVAIRKDEFAGYATLREPPGRIKSIGLVYQPGSFTSSQENTNVVPFTPVERNVLEGTGCCPGLARGIVKVVLNPQGATLNPGEILVAKRTDPGWIVLFPSAAGLIVENGSLLSHSAIISRELGLPSVIGVANATTLLKDGDYVEVDANTGSIHVLSVAATAEPAALLGA